MFRYKRLKKHHFK